MQLILPFPLFLPFDSIIGVLIGPNSVQLLDDIDELFSCFSFSFNHSVYSFPCGILLPFEVLCNIKSKFLAYGLYPFPFVYLIFFL